MAESKTVEELEAELQSLLQKKIQKLKDEETAEAKKKEDLQLQTDKEKERETLKTEIKKELGFTGKSKLGDDDDGDGDTPQPEALMLGDESANKVITRMGRRVERKTGNKMTFRRYEDQIADIVENQG